MKDDYYCSILAYCKTCRTLAVALTSKVYLWTEKSGVHYPPFPTARNGNFVTCLSFSSDNGGNAILAMSRHSGQVSLWSLFESEVRFRAAHHNPVSCIAFKPVVTYRQSATLVGVVPCEDLLVADDAGIVLFYSVEWPEHHSSEIGIMVLLVRIQAHTQNICGLAWSPTGDHIATGGNDNCALLFDVSKILQSATGIGRGRSLFRSTSSPRPITRTVFDQSPISPASSDFETTSYGSSPETTSLSARLASVESLSPVFRFPYQHRVTGIATQVRSASHSGRPRTAAVARSHIQTPLYSPPHHVPFDSILNPSLPLLNYLHTHTFPHSAAVKALTFAPWQPTLLATGGGSNDRQIHFHHTGSGATLAVINVLAQVTSLNWSKTRREIVATFGYAQPDHDIRIAVFSWPDCKCVVSIPWERKASGTGGPGEVGRALWAVAYPGGPNDGVETSVGARGRRRTERGRGRTREAEEEAEDDVNQAEGQPQDIGDTGNEEPAARFRVWDAEVAIEEYGRFSPRRGRGASRRGQAAIDAAFTPSHSSSTSPHTPHHQFPRQTTTGGLPTPPNSASPARSRFSSPSRRTPTRRRTTAAEGEPWTSRTQEEGGLIIACCDETVKFFEIWAGDSKGRKGKGGRGLGVGIGGVLGGSSILEGLEGVEGEWGVGDILR